MLEAGDDLGERCDDLGLAERHARVVHPLLEKFQNRIELPRGRTVMANRAQCLQADLARDLPGRHELLIRFLAAGIERRDQDRKSTRLNSSHPSISYAVFCLKKKKT